tara:strand:- start:1767 stop:2573 length:807 start_codon:yes stop_codon:yes gene_type:complete
MPLSMTGLGGGAGSLFRAGAGGGGWEILMATLQKTTYSSNAPQKFGYTGNNQFKSITENSTGANSRTGVGDGDGLYSAFFNKTGITQIAIVNDHKGGSGINPTTDFNRYIVYDLVSATTKTMYNIINDLDTFNRNNSSWAGNDSLYGANSVENFVAGNYHSGTMSADSGHFKDSTQSQTPTKFVIWGVNRDSDNDTQVLCSYYGNLQNGKSDSWRGNSPRETFWSYWGNDWHSNTQSQTISQGSQTPPGSNGSGVLNQSTLHTYLLAA